MSYGRMANEFSGAIDLRARMTGNESQTMTITEDEEDLVSTEELKHEMSAEKGLAWFDLGDGKVRKGKAFWFNTEIPDTWTGREFVTLLERFENDELGLADWVNEQILNQEEREGEFQKARQASLQGQQGPGGKPGSGPAPLSQTSGPPLNGSSKKDGGASKEADTSGPFKLNLAQGGRSRGRVNSFVMESQAEEEPKEQEEEQGAQQASKAGAGSKMMPFGRRR